MSGRRLAAVAVALVAGAGVLAVVAAGRVWASATPRAATGTRVHVHVAGHAVASALPALGLALLALSVAVVAARSFLRRVVGAVVVAAAAAVVVVSVHGHGGVEAALAQRAFAVPAGAMHATTTPWWLVAVAAGVIGVAGGLLTVIVAPRWTGLGQRYETPAARRPVDAASRAWQALDRGDDPTA